MLRKLDQVLALFTPSQPELSGPEIARAVRRPKSTVYRLLGSFTELGFLNLDRDTGRYRLGIRLAALGDLARHSTSLQRITLPSLRGLCEDTGELATLMILSGDIGVTIDVVESRRAVMVPGLLGGHLPLHATAGGKALLAWRSEGEVDLILRPPLTRYTPSTITDVETLKRQFAQARKRGYTTVNGEWLEEVVGVAAPIRNHRREVVAAFTTGCPRSRSTPAHLAAMGRAAIRRADEVSEVLGHHPEVSGNGASPR